MVISWWIICKVLGRVGGLLWGMNEARLRTLKGLFPGVCAVEVTRVFTAGSLLLCKFVMFLKGICQRADRQIEKQTDKQTDGHRQIDGEIHRLTERQTDK